MDLATRQQSSELHTATAQLYESVYGVLANVAIRRFGLPRDEAENGIQEVFLAYLRSATVIHNPKTWLFGAIVNFCREYWKRHGKYVPVGATEVSEHNVDGRILSSELLAQLPESSQTVLRLHYIEGLTAPEIAARLQTSARYAELLIHRGLSRARGLVRR